MIQKWSKSDPWTVQNDVQNDVPKMRVPKWLPSVQNVAHSVAKVSQKAPVRVPKVPKSHSRSIHEGAKGALDTKEPKVQKLLIFHRKTIIFEGL